MLVCSWKRLLQSSWKNGQIGVILPRKNGQILYNLLGKTDKIILDRKIDNKIASLLENHNNALVSWNLTAFRSRFDLKKRGWAMSRSESVKVRC